MSYARQLLDTYRGTVNVDAGVLAAAIGVTSRRASADASVTRLLLQACVAICKSCGDGCELLNLHFPAGDTGSTTRRYPVLARAGERRAGSDALAAGRWPLAQPRLMAGCGNTIRGSCGQLTLQRSGGWRGLTPPHIRVMVRICGGRYAVTRSCPSR